MKLIVSEKDLLSSDCDSVVFVRIDGFLIDVFFNRPKRSKSGNSLIDFLRNFYGEGTELLVLEPKDVNKILEVLLK